MPMRTKRGLFVAVLTASAVAAFLCAEALAQGGGVSVHDRIAEYFRMVPAGVLPSGDTLVTWRADGPILYHTAQRSGPRVSAGMFRNDALIGAAEVTWSSTAPTSFGVRWLGSSPLQLQGRVEGADIVISGSRTSRTPVPAMPWAIAEFGLDDLLLPLLDRLTKEPQRVAVFRPFAGKWDTLTAAASAREGFSVLTVTDAKGKQTWCATDARRQSCLWIQESTSAVERRPLEGTDAFRAYSMMRTALIKLP